MNRRIGLWRAAAVVLFAVLGLASSFAEVLYLVDGEILIGEFVSPDPQGFLYRTYKGDVVVPVGKLLRSAKTLDELSALPVELVLKDSSVIKGNIVDFDYDIGIFIDISFGTLTIPNTAVAKIMDPVQVSKYSGSALQYRVDAGAYFPLFGNEQFFGASWLASITLNARLPAVRGLFAGASLTFNDTVFTPTTTTKYFLLSVCPEVTWKLLDWRVKSGFLSILSPFATVGAGLAYINVSDPELYPPSYGNLTMRAYVKAGSEIAITPAISLVLDGYLDIFMQAQRPFYSAGATFGVAINQ